MKRYLLILLIIFAKKATAQDSDRSDYQRQLFELAISACKSGDYLEAIRTFSISNTINPKATIGEFAVKKADSLKSILRQNKINQLIGKWKWIPTDSNWALRDDDLVGKMIHINTKEIHFFELYKNSKEWKLVQTEKKKFSENLESPSFTELLYSNNEVWDYNVDPKSGQLITYYIGEKIEDNYTELVCGNQKLIYFKLQ
jgi:hypothetical protein